VIDSRVRKRKIEEHDEGEHEGFDATQLKEHEEFTKVQFGTAWLADELRDQDLDPGR
jgi:hypothetical protein